MLDFLPVEVLSRQITSSPSRIKRSIRWEPRKPAPPVTKLREVPEGIRKLEAVYEETIVKTRKFEQEKVSRISPNEKSKASSKNFKAERESDHADNKILTKALSCLSEEKWDS